MHKNLCSDRLGPKRVEFLPPQLLNLCSAPRKGLGCEATEKAIAGLLPWRCPAGSGRPGRRGFFRPSGPGRVSQAAGTVCAKALRRGVWHSGTGWSEQGAKEAAPRLCQRGAGRDSKDQAALTDALKGSHGLLPASVPPVHLGDPPFLPEEGPQGGGGRWGCEELPRAHGRDERLGTRHAHTHRGTRGTAGATVKSRQRLAASWLLARNPSRTIRINWTQAD